MKSSSSFRYSSHTSPNATLTDLFSIVPVSSRRGETSFQPFRTMSSYRTNETSDDGSTVYHSVNSVISEEDNPSRRHPHRLDGLTHLSPVDERSEDLSKGTRTIPLQRAFDLKEGQIFAERYRIQQRMPEKPLQLYAIHVQSGTKVVLRFYPWPYKGLSNSIAKHERLNRKHNEHICRLIEVIDENEQFPACAVFERGEFTLCNMLQQRDLPLIIKPFLVYNIFKALNSLHELKIVHGNLRPDNIMWFLPGFKCKIADFDKAHFAGEEAIPEISLGVMISETHLRYAAPEIIRSLDDQMVTRFCLSCDVWSAGIMAYELLTGKHFYGLSPNATYIRAVASWREPLPAVECRDRTALSFLKGILCMEPSERLTTSSSLRHNFFHNLNSAPNENVEMQEVSRRLGSLEEALHAQFGGTIASRLNTTIKLEWFAKDSPSKDPFEKRPTREAISDNDDYLPDEAAYYFWRIGESACLRIVTEFDPNMRIRIQDITSVQLKTPDSEFVELEKKMIANNGTTRCEIVALIDPENIPSRRLRAVCPGFGSHEEKYVRLDLRLEFVLHGYCNQTLETHQVLYCKMVSSDSRLIYQKFARALRQGWRSLPKWIRQTTKGFVCCARTAVIAV